MINVISALSLFAVLLYIYMGTFIYKAKKNAKLNRVFMLWCMSMAVWSFGYAFAYITTTSRNIWIMVSAVGWCFFGSFALHMVMLLTECRLVNQDRRSDEPLRLWSKTSLCSIKNPVLGVLLYLPGLIFWCLSIFVFLTDRPLPKKLESFYFTGSSISTFVFLILTIGLLTSWYFKNKNNTRIVNQAKILLIACSVSFAIVIVTQWILPRLGTNSLPLMSHLYALIVLFGAYYAMKHYRLFNISPQILNDMIFSEMMDLAILLSPDGRIQKISQSTETLLEYRSIDLLDKPIIDILGDPGISADMMDMKKGLAVRRYSNTYCLTKSGGKLPVSLSCQPLMAGRLKEPEGFVLLGHDIRMTKQLEKQIEEQKLTEDQLRQSEQRFRDIFYQNTAIMYLIDYDTLEIFDENKAARDFYGYSEKEFNRKKITDLNGFSEEYMKKLLNELYADKKNVYYFKHQTSGGVWRDVEVHTTPLFLNERKMLISIVTDITERKRAEEQITYLAYHDALTGLANRKYFYEKLHIELERSFRKGDKTAILFLDLDGFKQINDNYGHEAGDTLLQEVANRIKSNIREIDTVARMGGDEFTLLIVDITSRNAAEAVSKKISELFDEPVLINDIPVHIQASIGISVFPDDGRDMKQLVSKADNEMYAVKLKKRGKKRALPY
ncbi:MAG: diguanylate cyclase [Clostridiaceae bacterium]